MAPKRGSTIYIPLIVPENWQLAASLICGLIGLVCLLFALFTSNWNVTTIDVPETATTYPIQTTLKWGLRSIHIKWCITRTNSGGTAYTSCASEDIQYAKCESSDGYWCSSAADPFISYWLIIFSCIGLVLSTIFALSRRVFQPVGYSACVIACSVGIIIFRGCEVLFEPSGQLLDWINAGTSDTTQGVSYFVMTAGTFVLLIGMLLASWGTFKVARRGHETAPSTVDQPQPPQRNPTTSAQQQPQTASAAATIPAQFQQNERVMSVIASTAPSGQPIAGGLASPSKLVGIVPLPNTAANTSAGSGGNNNTASAAAAGLRRAAIDNEGMDFEALNEPSAVVMTEMPPSVSMRAGEGASRGGSSSPPPTTSTVPPTETKRASPAAQVDFFESATTAPVVPATDSSHLVPAAVSSPSQSRGGDVNTSTMSENVL